MLETEICKRAYQKMNSTMTFHNQTNSGVINGLLLLLSIIGATWAEQPYNPCIATLCLENTTCMAVPDPNNCPTPETCSLTAMCVPTGPQPGPVGPFCGNSRCPPGYRCGYVQVMCIQAPCPSFLGCVPIPGVSYPEKELASSPNPEALVENRNYAHPCQISCDLQCPPESHCELMVVPCNKTPCPLQQTCMLTSGNTCANVRCPSGTRCVMTRRCPKPEEARDSPADCWMQPACQSCT